METGKFLGIIFDFNGTLFEDSEKHNTAWRAISQKIRGYPFSDEELLVKMHGRTNRAILEYLTGSTLSPEEIEAYSEEKEQFYREMCLEDRENFILVPGAAELLDFLVENKIPRAIATASGKRNVDFFIDSFSLKTWFDLEKIVYDNGRIPGKPAPDIYLEAARRLGLLPGQCIVVEDAPSGIAAAHQAGIGAIIAIGPVSKHGQLLRLPGVQRAIENFLCFDKNLFNP